MHDFIYNVCFFYNRYAGNGRKNPEKYIYTKNKEKFPVWFPSHPPPSIKLEADCFPRRKKRKQAGPTLRGAGILIYRDKRNEGSGSVWVDRSR